MENKYDIFVSYSSRDQKVVEGICGYLERNGYRCFVAYRDIQPGYDWAEVIPDAIDKSSLFLAVVSEDFVVSKQTGREIGLAADNRKHIIPILTYRIMDVELKGAKRYYLQNLHWIDAFPEPERFFGKLLESISKHLYASNL